MQKPRLLIVEDQKIIVTNLKLLLKLHNYEVSAVAENVDDAIDFLDNNSVDLILMDISLPGDKDGIDAAHIVNQRWNIPVVYLTAMKDSAVIRRAKETAPYGFITKDIELKEQLPLVLEFALYKHRIEKEKLQQQAIIKESEEKFRSIVNTAKDAVVLLDNDGKIIFWNNAGSRIFGYTSDEVNNKFLHDLITPEAYKEYYRKGFTDFKVDGKGDFVGKTIELDAIRKDSKILPIEASMTSVKLKGLWCAFAIIRDISARKATEEEIERLVEELQISKDLVENNASEVMELNCKLSKSEEELRDLNASKDKFFSIIAHDLKGPFQSVLGFSELLCKDIDSFSMDEIKDFANEMNDASKQLFELLENLLHWTRLQKNSLEFIPNRQNLQLLVESSTKIYKFHAKEKNITLYTDIDDSINVSVDSNMMSTVFRNLIFNAIKFTRPDGILKIYTNKTVENSVELIFEDSGVGMSQEQLAKLFRIDTHNSTLGTNEEQGTGLGLILCKELVEKNEGSIKVESEKNTGSKFIISLNII